MAVKAVVALLSGSAALMSEALHSALDLLASLMAWISLRFSAHPPDWQHPYGHGKWENISAFLEGLLIVAVALGVFYQAGPRILQPVPLTLVPLGLAVLAASAGINLLVSWALKRAAVRFDSVALEAGGPSRHGRLYLGGRHGGVAGLSTTGNALFDTAAALGVGIIILGIGLKVTYGAFHGLLDSRLPDLEEAEVRQMVHEVEPILELKELRSRKAGPVRYLNLTLVVCRWVSLDQIHRVCDQLEAKIRARFPGAMIFIHPEPCLVKPTNGGPSNCTCPLQMNISFPVKGE
ncbi:MAG: cation diffusion facilitator family transporter [Pseudomonadota bacterium]